MYNPVDQSNKGATRPCGFVKAGRCCSWYSLAVRNVAQVMNVKATAHVPLLVVYHCQLPGWGMPLMEYDGPMQRMLVSWDDSINACLTPQAVDAAVLGAAATVADVLSASDFKLAVDAFRGTLKQHKNFSWWKQRTSNVVVQLLAAIKVHDNLGGALQYIAGVQQVSLAVAQGPSLAECVAKCKEVLADINACNLAPLPAPELTPSSTGHAGGCCASSCLCVNCVHS